MTPSLTAPDEMAALHAPLTEYTPPGSKPVRKNWRLKRSAMPTWYKQRNGVRAKALSGAARVAKHRPRPVR